MRLSLRIWRQTGPAAAGRFERFELDAAPTLTLLEALDLLNQRLIAEGQLPIAFESDCREGICGACGIVIQGHPHGTRAGRASCEVRVAGLAGAGELTLEGRARWSRPPIVRASGPARRSGSATRRVPRGSRSE